MDSLTFLSQINLMNENSRNRTTFLIYSYTRELLGEKKNISWLPDRESNPGLHMTGWGAIIVRH